MPQKSALSNAHSKGETRDWDQLVIYLSTKYPPTSYHTVLLIVSVMTVLRIPQMFLPL